MSPSKKGKNQAKQLTREKFTTNSGLVREVIIWSLPKSEGYPEGIKYRLILVNATTGKVLVLFDNHPPKGHHKHLEEIETDYSFTTLTRLIEDFLKQCEKWETKK